MTTRLMPKYPIYIPSKQRCDINMTTRFLLADGVPFYLVVEPQEQDIYEAKFGAARVLTLPANNQGLIFARNWIKDHATASGAERHWQVDDNICSMKAWHHRKRIACDAGVAFRAMEDFCDRYENVALAGPLYTMFIYNLKVPFVLNAHIYSCTLILNRLPNRFRPPANEDVDMCLQVLADGWTTVQFNYFLAEKKPTMTVKGGQTDSAYRGDGRLFMARSLQRAWPYVVRTKRRFQRPQHQVRHEWKHFDTPLKLKPGIDLASLPPNDYGLRLQVRAPSTPAEEAS
jgi:hypothetical protein